MRNFRKSIVLRIRHNRLLIFFCFLALLPGSGAGQQITPYAGPFPAPPANKNMLFYLQRTININTLVYEINYTPDGQLNKSKPIKIYWINFTDGGKMTPLTFAQNKFAYGIKSVALDAMETSFKIHLVSYKKISMYLKPSGKNGSYQVHVTIHGKDCILTNILVNITGGTHLKPVVSYIELIGNTLHSGERTVEKIETEKHN